MNWTCIIVNFSGGRAAADWRLALKDQEFPMAIEYYTRAESVNERLQNPGVGAMVVFADDNTASVESVLESFQRNVGCLPENQAIVCDDPSPILLAHIFEYGLENIFASERWASDTAAHIRNVAGVLEDPDSLESKIIKMTSSLRGASDEVRNALTELHEISDYDFRAAHTRGQALQKEHKKEAAEAYCQARAMNHMFKPATRNFGELLLDFGRFEEAVALFEQLNKQNPNSINHKSSLVRGHIAQGNLAKANQFAQQAMAIDSGNKVAIEASAQVMLASGEVDNALKLLGSLGTVSIKMVGLLNKTGITYSKQGDLDGALDFFRRSHKLCPQEECYKVSINAAIACVALGHPSVSIRFLNRCEKEYGSSFAKLDKIRRVANSLINKAKAVA